MLFVDELHTMLGAGAAEGAMDAANMLKPLLARGELRMIGATTLAEYRTIERDGALARRFSAVTVEEPSVEETVEILRGLRRRLRGPPRLPDRRRGARRRRAAERPLHHRVPPARQGDRPGRPGRCARAACAAAASTRRLRERIETLRAEKQAAIDAEDYEDARPLKDEIDGLEARLAEARRRRRRRGRRGRGRRGGRGAHRHPASASWWPASSSACRSWRRDLHQRVIGQDEAVETVADTIRRARVGLSEGDRPLGTFLFLGPTGVGKTELVKALSERLFATENALVRIDMSEYREPHTVARLIGSPPGYVGYGDGGQLTEPVRRRPYSVILLDEIEKAHPEVWNVLLQLMDDGRLTDGEGRTVDFNNAVVVMTSNLGAGKARRGIGFTAGEPGAQDDRMLAAAKGAFLPEFLNRIDEIVTFRPLTGEQVEQHRRADRARRWRSGWPSSAGSSSRSTPRSIARLAREGFDEELGARPLLRHVRRTLEKELTRAILAGELADGSHVRARDDDGRDRPRARRRARRRRSTLGGA